MIKIPACKFDERLDGRIVSDVFDGTDVDFENAAAVQGEHCISCVEEPTDHSDPFLQNEWGDPVLEEFVHVRD